MLLRFLKDYTFFRCILQVYFVYFICIREKSLCITFLSRGMKRMNQLNLISSVRLRKGLDESGV